MLASIRQSDWSEIDTLFDSSDEDIELLLQPQKQVNDDNMKDRGDLNKGVTPTESRLRKGFAEDNP